MAAHLGANLKTLLSWMCRPFFEAFCGFLAVFARSQLPETAVNATVCCILSRLYSDPVAMLNAVSVRNNRSQF